jgi:XTP/dITP diphosphohydrolase
MKDLIFATNNAHKLLEIKKVIDPRYRITGLKEHGIHEEIPEDFFTLEENAFQKAAYVYEKYGYSCFSDDTGLEIEALDGEPGVFSARYSRMGNPVYPHMDVSEGNIRKVLEKLEGEGNRKARFRTVIALIMEGKRFAFEGIVEGVITEVAKGTGGFGYDPIFIPGGGVQTFAEMTLSEKNRISHRARAIMKLTGFLNTMDDSSMQV